MLDQGEIAERGNHQAVAGEGRALCQHVEQAARGRGGARKARPYWSRTSAAPNRNPPPVTDIITEADSRPIDVPADAAE